MKYIYVSAVGYLEKPGFGEIVSFHNNMIDVTNFGLVLQICIVCAIIFNNNKTKICKLVQDTFWWMVKDPKYDIVDYFDKSMPFFLQFFSLNYPSGPGKSSSRILCVDCVLCRPNAIYF